MQSYPYRRALEFPQPGQWSLLTLLSDPVGAPSVPLGEAKLVVRLVDADVRRLTAGLGWSLIDPDLYSALPRDLRARLEALAAVRVQGEALAEESGRLVPHAKALGARLSEVIESLRRSDPSCQYLAALGAAKWGPGRLGLHYHVLLRTAARMAEGSVEVPGGRLSVRPLPAWDDARRSASYVLNWERQGGRWLPPRARRLRASGGFPRRK